MAAANRKPISLVTPLSEAEAARDRAVIVVGDLEARRGAAERRVVEINDALKPLAYATAQREAAAVKATAKFVADRHAAEQEIETCNVALIEARERVTVAGAAVIAAEYAEREADLAGLCAQFLENSKAIDDALAAIVTAQAARRKLYSGIAALAARPGFDVADPTRRLLDDDRLDIAFRFVGAHLIFGRYPSDSRGDKSLADMDRQTIAGLRVTRR